jgi:hypothetical protein
MKATAKRKKKNPCESAVACWHRCREFKPLRLVRSWAKVINWVYGHPCLRIFCASASLVLLLVMFLEDPQTYSNSDLSLPVVGITLNFLFRGYPSPDSNPRWLALKVAMIVVFPLLAVLLAEFTFRRLLLQRLFNLRGFKKNKGILLCAFVAVVLSLWGSAILYNDIIAYGDHHYLSFMNSFGRGISSPNGGPPNYAYRFETDPSLDKNEDGWCDDDGPVMRGEETADERMEGGGGGGGGAWKRAKADLESTYASSDLPVANGTFMVIAFYLSILGGCYTLFGVTDAVLQDKVNYRSCCFGPKERCWPAVRVPAFWIFATLCVAGACFHANYVVARGGGYLYWQGMATAEPLGVAGDAILTEYCASFPKRDGGGDADKEASADCQRDGDRFVLMRNRSSNDGTANFSEEGLPVAVWFSNYVASVGSDGNASSILSFEKNATERAKIDPFDVQVYRETGKEKIPGEPVISVGYSEKILKGNVGTVNSRVFPGRGYWGVSEIGRIWIASIILILGIIIVSQDVAYPHYDCENDSYNEFFSRHNEVDDGGRGHNDNDDDDDDNDDGNSDAEYAVAAPPLKIPGLNGDSITLPSFGFLRTAIRLSLKCMLVDDCCACDRVECLSFDCEDRCRYFFCCCRLRKTWRFKNPCNAFSRSVVRCYRASASRVREFSFGDGEGGCNCDENRDGDEDENAEDATADSEISLTSSSMSWEDRLETSWSGSFSFSQDEDENENEGRKGGRSYAGLERQQRSDEKRRKNKPQFVTNRWLMYSVIVFVSSLDAINLYSQVIYDPASYGQLVDYDGYIYPAVGGDDGGTVDRLGFRYDVLQTMCPHRMGKECLDDDCYEKRKKSSLAAASADPGFATRSMWEPLDVVVEKSRWTDGSEVADSSRTVGYASRFAALDVSYDRFERLQASAVLDPGSVANEAFRKEYWGESSTATEGGGGGEGEGRRPWGSFDVNDLFDVFFDVPEMASQVGASESFVFLVSNATFDVSRLKEGKIDTIGVRWERHVVLRESDQMAAPGAPSGTTASPAASFGSKDGDVHLFRGKRCACYEIAALEVNGIAEEGTEDGLETLGSEEDGRLGKCYYDGEGEDAARNRPNAKNAWLLDGTAEPLKASCSKVVAYEMALTHEEYVGFASLAFRLDPSLGTPSFSFPRTKARSALDWMNAVVWIYDDGGANGSGSESGAVRGVGWLDARCAGCSQRGDANSSLATSSRALKYSGTVRLSRKKSEVDGEKKDIPDAVGVYFSKDCGRLRRGNDSFAEPVGPVPPQPDLFVLEMKEYGCVTTVGSLNVKYLGHSTGDKLAVCLLPVGFVAVTVTRIAVDYVWRSLLKWKVKTARTEAEGERGEGRKEEEENAKERASEKRKRCLLKFCFCLHCTKKSFVKKIDEKREDLRFEGQEKDAIL